MGISDFQKLDKWEYLIFKSWINGKTPVGGGGGGGSLFVIHYWIY